MRDGIYSLWQDYESHLFTCKYCQTQNLGKDLVHDFDASELVLPLDCPSCERRLALLNIQASEEEIHKFATQGFKTALNHLAQPKRLYESWPDFTEGEDEQEAISRMAHSIDFMADPKLGQDAVQFMTMVAWGLKNATEETPYIVESEGDESKYFQVIRGTEGEYYSEIASPEAAGKPADDKQRDALAPLGWIMPNEDSPNYHREYVADTDQFDIASDAARGWFVAYGV